MESDTKQSRIAWIDTAKGLGIVLVVLGHVLRGLTSAHVMESTFTTQFIDTWIYSFHMPLFFLLSGLFLFRSSTKSSLREYVTDKVRTIGYPYLVWSIVTVLLKAALGPIPNAPRGISDLLLIPYSPIEQFWFLYALFILVLFFGTMFALGLKPGIAIVIALLVYPAVFSLSSGWSVLHVVRTYAIYVALGSYVGANYLRELPRSNAVILTLAVIIGLGVPLADIAIHDQQSNELLSALSGTIGIAAVSLLLNRFGINNFIAFLGTCAIEIFVCHTIASASGRIALEFLHIRSPGIHLAVGIVAGLTLPIALSYVFKIIGFRFGFTLPKSTRKANSNEGLGHKTV